MNFSDLKADEISSEFLKKALKEIDKDSENQVSQKDESEDCAKQYLTDQNFSATKNISEKDYEEILEGIGRSHVDLLQVIRKGLISTSNKK